MKKRVLAAFLSLIMIVSLLPLAVSADAVPDTDVKIGHYEDGKWVDGEPNHSSLPDGVKTVSKTAVKTGENEYDVTLEVVLETTETQSAASAATVLVMDTSTSMSLCSQCGKELGNRRHRPHPAYSEVYNIQTYGRYYVLVGDNYKEVTYCDGEHSHLFWTEKCSGGAGWYTSTSQNSHTTGNKLTPKTSATSGGVQFYTRSNTADVSRMNVAKEAAVEFLKAYSGFEETSFNTDGSLKSGTADKNIGRYVAVVMFNTTGKISQNWVDVSTTDGYKSAYDAIEKLSENGGTNVDAGLRFADYLFDQTTVSGIELKNTILLTDGEPTFYLNTVRRDNEGSVKIGDTTYYAHGGGSYCNENTYNATINTADTLKYSGEVSLYTVCFGVADQKMVKEVNVWGTTTKYWDVTVGEYLENSIATTATADNTYAYNANNTDELIGAFKAITSSIVSGISAGTVTDSLPRGITATVDLAKTWELKPEDAEETTVGNKTTYTYKKTYTVTIDPETVEIDENGYTPLNGETTLTVGETQIQFPIPAGKVTQKEYEVNYILDSEAYSTTDKVRAGTTNVAVREAPAERVGYVFSGWTTNDAEVTDGKFTMPKNDVTFTGSFTPADGTAYTVEHYKQLAGGTNYALTNYELAETEDLEGTTGANVTLTASDAKTYEGFEFDEDSVNNIVTGTIAADGSLVLKLYYNKKSYNVKYEYTGTVPAGASELPETKQFFYGERLWVAGDATAPGYVFSGWTTEDVEVRETTAPWGTGLRYWMPAKDVTFTGYFTEYDDITVTLPLIKLVQSKENKLPEESFEYEIYFLASKLTEKDVFTVSMNGEPVEVTEIDKKEDIQNIFGLGDDHIERGNFKAYSIKVSVGTGSNKTRYVVQYLNNLTFTGKQYVFDKFCQFIFSENLTAEQTADGWELISDDKEPYDIGEISGVSKKRFYLNGVYESPCVTQVGDNWYFLDRHPENEKVNYVVFTAVNKYTPKTIEPEEIAVNIPFVKEVKKADGALDPTVETFEYEIVFSAYTDEKHSFKAKLGEKELEIKLLTTEEAAAKGLDTSDTRRKFYSVKFGVETLGESVYEGRITITGTVNDIANVNGIYGFENLTDAQKENWTQKQYGTLSNSYAVNGYTEDNGKNYFTVLIADNEVAPVKVGFTNTYEKMPERTEEKKVTLPHWVTLKYMNGNDQLKRKAYIYDDLAKLNYTPTRDGYKFTGWYVDSSCTVKITQIRMKGDIKVYAGWEKLEK